MLDSRKFVGKRISRGPLAPLNRDCKLLVLHLLDPVSFGELILAGGPPSEAAEIVWEFSQGKRVEYAPLTLHHYGFGGFSEKRLVLLTCGHKIGLDKRAFHMEDYDHLHKTIMKLRGLKVWSASDVKSTRSRSVEELRRKLVEIM